MSSENRKGNSHANNCGKHGDYIGLDCPVCAGKRREAKPTLDKYEYMLLHKHGFR